MSNLISGVSSVPSNVTYSVVISQENTTSVSASFDALPGIQISGNNVVNVFYNQIPTQSNNQLASRKKKDLMMNNYSIKIIYQCVTFIFIIITIHFSFFLSVERERYVINNLLHLVSVNYDVISLVLCISTRLRLVTILTSLMK